MNNYLNEVTSKSISRFSIDTAQQALQFLKNIQDGKNVNYNSWSDNEQEESDPTPVDKILIKDDTQKIDTKKIEIKIECGKIIRQSIIDNFKVDTTTLITLYNKYYNMFKIFDDNSTNLQKILDLIKKDSNN